MFAEEKGKCHAILPFSIKSSYLVSYYTVILPIMDAYHYALFIIMHLYDNKHMI